MSDREITTPDNRPDAQRVQQSILENVQVGGNLTTGDNIQNISIYQPEPPNALLCKKWQVHASHAWYAFAA
jgi:hypothetical protein